MKVVSPEAIPEGALGAFINMLLMLVTIWIGNASDYLRDKLRRVRFNQCRASIGLQACKRMIRSPLSQSDPSPEHRTVTPYRTRTCAAGGCCSC